MSAQPATGSNANAAAAGLTPHILPPNIFDPRLNGADWYTYAVDAGNSPAPSGGGQNLAAAGVSNPNLQIDAGTDFYLIALSMQAQVSGAGGVEDSTNPIPLVTMQLNDSGSQRNLFSMPIPMGAIVGEGRRPYRLIRPRIFRANSVLAFTFTSFEPTDAYAHIYLLLHGYRKFVTPATST